MQAFTILAASFLIGHALGQDTPSLTELLRSTAELSQFASVTSQAPDLLSSLLSAANVTILAPSNDAFAAVGNDSLQALAANSGLLTRLLQYHVLNGTFETTYFTQSSKFVPSLLTDPQFTNVTDGQRVEGVQSGSNIVFYSGLLSNSTVTSAGLTFTGGVVHVVDRLLVLPELVTDTTAAANLTSLTGALEAASLQQSIDTSKDLTFFAPTNLAFQDIGSVLANLTTENLVDILAYHAIQGSPVNIGSYGYGKSTTLESIQGSNITITTGQNGVFVNNARVVVPNVLVANGVMHIIDAVLNPTNQTIASSTATSGVVAYAGAESVTDGVFTSGVPTPSGNIIPPSQSSGSSTGSGGNPSGPNLGSGGLSTGAKAGIGIGAAAGAALLLGVGVLLGRKGKNKQGGTTATTATGVAEMEDQDRSHAKKKWFLGGNWRSEADAQQPAQELDSKMVHVVGEPPAELDGSGSTPRR